MIETQNPIPVSEDQLAEMKLQFAEGLLRKPDDPYKAALPVANGDTMLALRILDAWQYDPEVEACKRLLLEKHGAEHFLPTKEELIYEILQRGRESTRDEDFVKCMRLAADMRGHIEKPGVTVNNTVNHTTNKVMAIPMMVNAHGDPANTDDWERSLIEQQERLTQQ